MTIPNLTPAITTNAALSQEHVLQTVQTVVMQCIGQNVQGNAAHRLTNLSQEIDANSSFDALGFDSVARVGLVSELEKVFNITLDPAAAFDYVTVGALSTHVWGQATGQPVDVHKLLDV